MKIEGKEVGSIMMGLKAKIIVIVYSDGTTSRIEGKKFTSIMGKQFKASLEAKLSKKVED